MKKLYILVNKLSEFSSFQYVEEYLNDVLVSIGESFPQNNDEYDLILLWNYKNIIRELGSKSNVVVFHSSDLPRGKGWAPIYYTIANKEEYYTVTGILANEQVDAGNILVKARFKMKDNYTADQLRDWDNRIMLMLSRELIHKQTAGGFGGMPQEGAETFYKRRKPEDNEVNTDETLGSMLNHLRACELQHPAFFWFNNTKYFIYICPEIKSEFPTDLEIEFYGLNLK